ncbi:alpha/beta hydrolase [Legionella spiritensis]|uniref:alpha/beta hydrolase n=1 Tax=Legionella spiritensis TaxID=452 RepID=UPI000F70FD1D|nr:hypothetical protein [Legionella spiritensis]VEG91375.1 transmembrane protein [Legionella spiritensis]
MLFTEPLSITGEHPFVFPGQSGQLEGVLTVPSNLNRDYIAVLGHPNSLQGGSMTNKVVTTMARAFREAGIPSLRFNFRGVGRSEGQYNNGLGESEDMLLLSRLWEQEFPDSRFLYAGFSFGSYVTYRTAAQHPHDMLISVAPPVHLYDYQAFKPAPKHWHILQGDSDEVVPAQSVLDFATEVSLPVTRFADTGHFFHGRLLELRAELIKIITERVS